MEGGEGRRPKRATTRSRWHGSPDSVASSGPKADAVQFGSARNRADLCVRPLKGIASGTIVWAKQSGFPWWPALVFRSWAAWRRFGLPLPKPETTIEQQQRASTADFAAGLCKSTALPLPAKGYFIVHFLGPSLSYALLRNDQAAMRLFVGGGSELGKEVSGGESACSSITHGVLPRLWGIRLPQQANATAAGPITGGDGTDKDSAGVHDEYSPSCAAAKAQDPSRSPHETPGVGDGQDLKSVVATEGQLEDAWMLRQQMKPSFKKSWREAVQEAREFQAMKARRTRENTQVLFARMPPQVDPPRSERRPTGQNGRSHDAGRRMCKVGGGGMFEALPEEVLERLCRGLSDQVLSRMKQIGMRFYVFIQEFAVTLRRPQLYGSFALVGHRHSRTNDSVEGSWGCWGGRRVCVGPEGSGEWLGRRETESKGVRTVVDVAAALRRSRCGSQVCWKGQMGMADDTAPLFGSPVVSMSKNGLWLAGDYDGRPGFEFMLRSDLFHVTLDAPGASGTHAARGVWGEYRIARGDKPRHGISSTIGCSVPLLGEGPGAAELVTFTWSGLDADAYVDLGRLYTLPLPSDAAAMDREDETAQQPDDSDGDVDTEWRELKVGGEVPSARQAFALCAVDGGLILFGGRGQTQRKAAGKAGGKGCAARFLGDLCLLWRPTMTWYHFSQPVAQQRSHGVSSRPCASDLISPSGLSSGDLVPQHTSESIAAAETAGKLIKGAKGQPQGQWPSARAGHSLTKIGSWLYLFGGIGGKACTDCFQLPAPPVFRLQCTPAALKTMRQTGGSAVAWESPPVSGMIGAGVGQSAHGTAAVGSNLIVFAGVTRSGRYSNALAVLSTSPEHVWSQPQLLPGVTVSPRAYPTVLFDGNHLLVFGGLGRLRAGSAYQQSDYKADLHRLTFVLCDDEGQTD